MHICQVWLSKQLADITVHWVAYIITRRVCICVDTAETQEALGIEAYYYSSGA